MPLDRLVTVIGVGNRGSAMAANLLTRGWPVKVCDIDPSKVAGLKPFGALALDLHAQAAINSIAYIVCIGDKPGDAARMKLVNNLLGGINPVGSG
jgi:3-hydroxyisobutyrate dehydrogenase-like beta-hydroxyacid dehydrogenase